MAKEVRYVLPALVLSGIMVLIALLYYVVPITCKDLSTMKLPIQSYHDVKALFPKTAAEITQRGRCAMEQAKKELEKLIALPDSQRTFDNTAKSLDRITALSELSVFAGVVEVIEYVHPQEDMRQAAHAAQIAIKEFIVDNISSNQKLYLALKKYAEHKEPDLRPDQEYYLKETMDDFRRAGLDLPIELLEQVKTLQKALATLTTQFETNISVDNKSITVSEQGLAGLDKDFISNLMRTDSGEYVLGTDYPTYFHAIENCEVADTRKRLFIAMNNRGYPANEAALQGIIAKRDALAHLLGFADYAHLDVDAEMAKTPERVREFLQGLYTKASVKADQEYALFKQELPASVKPTDDGKLNPWDVAYVKNLYKKKYLQVDECVLSEYFPMNHTIKGLLGIYEQFFGLRFELVPVSGFWHEDVQLVAAHNKQDDTLLGYLLLDLHPRSNKYNHACHATIIPSVFGEDGSVWPAVSLVIANFPKSTATKPALLKRDDVRTFFHEFGHAMHALLGRTFLASQSGTAVKRDFVEMPSQMLEEWLWDDAILKKISSHYKTGEPLSDELIRNIKKLKHFDSGDWTQRQVYLSSLSLALFESGAPKDPQTLQERLYAALRPHVLFWHEDHMYASFGHLTGYAARYYGYLWSKVFALDLFAYIKEHGLLDAHVGQRYVSEVLGKGGCQDPNLLLKNFLGRLPNDRAFLADLGL